MELVNTKLNDEVESQADKRFDVAHKILRLLLSKFYKFQLLTLLTLPGIVNTFLYGFECFILLGGKLIFAYLAMNVQKGTLLLVEETRLQ